MTTPNVSSRPRCCDCPTGYCQCPSNADMRRFALEAANAGEKDEALYWLRRANLTPKPNPHYDSHIDYPERYTNGRPI